MDVDEIAHALGIVFCGSPVGDLDPAPGTMHVDENEEIDRAIATILISVTFELARPGRNGLTHLTDELHRAFGEAHHGPSGVGRLGLEIEHFRHAGAVLAVDLLMPPSV